MDRLLEMDPVIFVSGSFSSLRVYLCRRLSPGKGGTYYIGESSPTPREPASCWRRFPFINSDVENIQTLRWGSQDLWGS